MQKYSGSKRTFTALLKKMIEKKKFGLVLALTRRNAAPVFCAMLPQVSFRFTCLSHANRVAVQLGGKWRRRGMEGACRFSSDSIAIRGRY